MSLDLKLLQAVMGALPDPVFILTEQGDYAALFGGINEGLYHDCSSLVGRNLDDVLPAGQADWFRSQITETLREQQLRTVEYTLAGTDVEGLDDNRGPDGDIRFEGRIQPLSFQVDGKRAVVWVARNITRRHQLELELRRLSEVDELTGVYNRRRFLEGLKARYLEFRRYGQSTSLIMFDLDYFKQINDRFGHLAGDQVLRNLVATCRRHLRDVDLFARFGGEEFVVLLPSTHRAEALATAERLRSTAEQLRLGFSQGETRISISAGVSAFLDSDADYGALIGRVDDALYEAKQRGRNLCVIR